MRRAIVLVMLVAVGFPAPAGAHWVPGEHNRWHAIRKAFKGYSWQAWSVALCESDVDGDGAPNPDARNGQYRGMFQMGEGERARWGHGPDPWSQARAAADYFYWAMFNHPYGGWGPWSCKP